MSQISYGNGLQTGYDYYDSSAKIDSASGTAYSYLLRSIQVVKGSTSILNLAYGYDKVGNVAVKQDANDSNLSESYSYDELNRLTGAKATVYGSKTFSYDTIDNILQKDGYNYQYDPIKPYTLIHDGRYSYTYDANGSLTGRSDGRTISWDYENRAMIISDGGGYVYNAQGQRIKKVNNDGTTKYYFFPEYEEEYAAGVLSKTVKYYFANKQRMAENSSTSGVRYYSKDHLGSSSAITDAVGNLVLRTVNAPYGSEVYNQGSGDVSYKFTDKEKDNTGLNYFGARFYDPEMGRFISVDPAKDGINWYAYCNDNPVKLVDLNGKQPVKAQSGTANRFAEEMNNSPSKIDTTTGVAGMNALVYLGSSNGFEPVATPYFNMSSSRYVYTISGGWIDMVHFLYYAGIAENNKITGAVNPVRSAVDTGKFQELIDQIKAPWSSYSYEDLPSDFFGANFAVNFYDPNSSLTLSGQIVSYLNMLGATDPQIAPNWELMPESDSKNPPMATNNTTDPMFTLNDGDADN